ncbi:DUF262 domain-containing protein [Steroidobacter sp. S1-65]|uniref:DUF262 domain-containing protein n=1 Tax=Steroidobacter gossypii TaxID=2805490 RepID=A0ABS1X5V7_9GAMM|nr:DUF262 domain-containing protein [Steroidobacter gossypii]MBM0108593.1 DUF262 domain-containing protein [Steroidobacter gossypii]
MSYTGISVREALERINSPIGGWYLPEVQRQYVWGSRDESEEYVCLLLDSLLRKYPIGGIVLWQTKSAVPFREFVGDYAPGNFALLVDQGRWSMEKSLVYDGQQRLQTLFSVLYHRFKDRILHYDLLFDAKKEEPDETGFDFRDADAPENPRFLRMTRLVSLSTDQEERINLESEATRALGPDHELVIKRNIAALWDVFVETNQKSIAYFSVRADSAREVNEVFRRLNTGGVALTQLELILGQIKAVQPTYEESLWKLSNRIKDLSAGYEFLSADVLQFFHLLVKGTIRIDAERVNAEDVASFRARIGEDADTLIEMFQGYLYGLFRINHASIIPRPLALLPIAAYLTARRRAGHEWRIRGLPDVELTAIHQFFLLSQFCDWATQTMVNAFARSAIDAGEVGKPFPIEEARRTAIQKNRTSFLRDQQFLSRPWFAAKVLMPQRAYIFHEHKPQVDHIFPLNLAGRDEQYKREVDVLWNFQPMPAEVNNYKRAKHPRDFFRSEEGGKYWDLYDFIPSPDSELWDDHQVFLTVREQKMRARLNKLYGIVLKPSL